MLRDYIKTQSGRLKPQQQVRQTYLRKFIQSSESESTEVDFALWLPRLQSPDPLSIQFLRLLSG